MKTSYSKIANITIEKKDLKTISNLSSLDIIINFEDDEFWWVSSNAISDLNEILSMNDEDYREELNYLNISRKTLETLLEILNSLNLEELSDVRILKDF